jgi:HSP20 family protein
MFVLSRPVQRPVSFNHAVDRLFGESLDRYFGGAATGTPSRTPALDVSESDSAYSVVFEVPGVTREQLKVSIEGRRVSIETVDLAAPAPASADATVEQAKPAADAAARVLYRERSAARYARTVSLPAEVDQSASVARFDNGVLTLTLAKKVPTGATTLSIS